MEEEVSQLFSHKHVLGVIQFVQLLVENAGLWPVVCEHCECGEATDIEVTFVNRPLDGFTF